MKQLARERSRSAWSFEVLGKTHWAPEKKPGGPTRPTTSCVTALQKSSELDMSPCRKYKEQYSPTRDVTQSIANLGAYRRLSAKTWGSIIPDHTQISENGTGRFHVEATGWVHEGAGLCICIRVPLAFRCDPCTPSARQYNLICRSTEALGHVCSHKAVALRCRSRARWYSAKDRPQSPTAQKTGSFLSILRRSIV